LNTEVSAVFTLRTKLSLNILTFKETPNNVEVTAMDMGFVYQRAMLKCLPDAEF